MDARRPLTSDQRSLELAMVLALTVALGTPGLGHAQIVRDGTVGPAGPLAGPNYTIPHTDGTRAGGNLFHSFGRFNIRTGERATFTGPNEIRNVISRVTGGERSTIDGLLRSQVGQANVWFLNPAGVLFGPNAQLDVPAAFHVSTADEVRLADGARFSASAPAASRLSVAPPEAFGFLRPNPAGIAVNGSTLQTPAGQTLSVIGGDLHVTGGQIRSEGGQVHLVAMAGPGTVRTKDGAPSVPAGGAVRLAPKAAEQGARVDTSGNGGGQITLRGGQIELAGSSVLADNTGTQDAKGGITVAGNTIRVASGELGSSTRGSGRAGRVAIQAHQRLELGPGGRIRSDADAGAVGQAGVVALQGDQVLVTGDGGQTQTFISSDTNQGALGKGGQVTVTARNLELHNGGWISSDTYGQGQAGTVTIHADRLLVSGDGARNPNGTPRFTGIASAANRGSTGAAGAVTVSGHDIAVRNGGQILSSTFAQGNAGTVSVQADRLLVSGDSAAGFSLIASSADKGSSGQAGDVTVTGRDIAVRNGGQIHSSTFAQGHAGTVSVQADRLLVSGDGARNPNGTPRFTGIASAADRGSTGAAGDVTVTGHDIELRNGGQIHSATFAQGQAGTVTLHADRLLVSGDGARGFTGIASDANRGSTGAAGDVKVTGRDIELRNGGQISTTSDSPQSADKVSLTASGSLRLTAGARIASSAWQADAEPITLRVGDRLQLTGSAITTQAEQGGGGQITLTVGRLVYLQGSRITSSVSGPASGAGAGQITTGVIDPQFLVLREGSRIQANATGGRAGNIHIDAEYRLVEPDSRIEARSQRGPSGRVEVGPERNIAGSLMALPINFLDARALLPTACAARLGGEASSLAAARSARLPVDPDRPLLPSYLSYTGPQPPDRAAPSGGAAEEGAQEAGLDPVPASAGRLSFDCKI